MPVLRFLMLLSLIVWLGGLIFFAAAVPQAAFGQLPTRHMAGLVVGFSLNVLHWMGIVSGIVFLMTSMTLSHFTTGSAHPLAARHLLIAFMLLLTCVSQFGISPKMHAIRTAVVEIDKVPVDDPARVRFNALHVWSEQIEKGVLLAGLVLAYLVAQQLK